MSETKQKKFAFPHTLVIIFCMIIFVAILTYIIPAGSYDRIEVDGRQVVDPNSFHYVEGNPASLFDIFVAVPSGMKQVAYIANFVLVISGAFAVIESTGATRAVLANAGARMLAGALDSVCGLPEMTRDAIVSAGTWAGAVSSILE